MPAGKGTYGSKRGRPAKKATKEKLLLEVEKLQLEEQKELE